MKSKKVKPISLKITIFIAVIGAIICWSIIKSRNLVNIYYVKTPTEELICWDKNICSWTWVHKYNYDKTLITNAGILQKNYPDNIVFKKKLLSVKKNSQSYSPISNYQITTTKIFVDVFNGTEFQLYSFDKKEFTSKIANIDNSSTHIISSISPDESNILVSSYINKKDLFGIYDFEKNIFSMWSSINSFKWISNEIVEYGVVNQCNPEDINIYECSTHSNLLNCSSFPRVPLEIIESMNDSLELYESLYIDIPINWDFEYVANRMVKRNYENDVIDKSYITWNNSCVSENIKISRLYNQTQVINSNTLKIKLFSPPMKQDDGTYLLANAWFEKNSKFYDFYLSTESQDKTDNQLLISNFLEMLKSTRFNTDYHLQRPKI